MTTSTTIKLLVILLLGLIVLLPRITKLGDFQTADEKMWVANTQGFTKNLALFKLDKLLQQPHPGITTMWLSATAINNDSLASKKIPLAIGQSVLIGLIAYIFFRLWGALPAIFLTLLIALNPFLIAHTRVFAMDSLLASFLLLSVGCLLLWRKNNATRYLIFAAIAGALAVLSKLPGIIIFPYSVLLLVYFSWSTPAANNNSNQPLARIIAYWILTFSVTLILVFPSLLLNFTEVTHIIREFISQGDVQNIHGPTNYTYYLKSLIFFSTPLQLIALAAVILLWKKITNKETVIILLLFASLFILQMALGAKKGDRYILPSFLMLDVLVIAIIVNAENIKRNYVRLTVYGILVTGVLWQAVDVIRLHPHTLAYVNAISKPFLGDRRLGWGEGYDLAREYLHEQPNPSNLKVAAQFSTEFAYQFEGQVIPLNHFDGSNADYVIVYRAMLERGAGAWETDIINQFKDRRPAKIIQLNNIDYVWIYKI